LEKPEVGDQESPILLQHMIEKEKIILLANEKLTVDQFLVGVTVSASNVIHVMVDSDTGISINQIVEISRHIENGLNREEEDFELSVFSAGLSEPFNLVRQYKKNVGAEIEVILLNGIKFIGMLSQADDQGIDLEITTKEKIEGSKKRELVIKVHHFGYSEIKEAKKIIKF
jgi:ribosome maturation factor RimP